MNRNNTDLSENGCVPQETVINNVVLAHAYVPFQKLCDTFTPLGSLKAGTAFPPFTGLYSQWEKKGMKMYDE